MKLTLMRLIVVGAAMPLLAAAQEPPIPPKKLVDRELKFEPRFELKFEPKFELEHQLDLMSPKLEEVRLRAEEMRLHAMEVANIDVERIKFQAEEMRQFANLDVDRLRFQAEEMSRKAMLDLPLKMDFSGSKMDGFVHGSDKLLDGRPRAPWAHEDPADSLYRAAREALNRGEYRRAAQLFNEVTKKFPKSEYALDCAYWEAFSRYRAGTTDDLRLALKILDERRAQLAELRKESNVDVQALRARVQGALAARGDREAAAQLQSEAAQSNSCDREEVSVRAEALSALGQMDLATAMPVVKKVLLRRDECTVELRRRALYLIGRHPSGDAVPIMLDVAKNDTDANIRGEAMSWLSRVAGDQAVPMLEDLLRTSTDERTQRSAIMALGSIDTERARRAVRAIIERNDAAERVRYDAIINLSREREGRSPSAEDMNYLRSLYGKLEAPRLREAVLTSISRVATPENEQFLLALARNQNESPSLRATALQRLGRMSSVGLDDIAKLYEVADSRSLREQILHALNQRKEPEAVDKMIEIARKDTDPQIRRTAISLLSRRDDPRAKKWLQEMWDK
jgi:HEAT repeat protein